MRRMKDRGGERQSRKGAGEDIQGVALTHSHPSFLLTPPPPPQPDPLIASCFIFVFSALDNAVTAYGALELLFEPEVDDGFKWQVAEGKVRPIHKCIAGYGERGPSQRRISGCLKALALGGEEGRPHRRFTGAHCLSHQSANPVSHFADYAYFPDRTGDTPQGEGTKKQGLYALLCLNNDVGSMNRGARYSPWSFGSWPAASLVKAPVSNDPCQRLPCTAVMTYHTSSL
ncbi:hypothetical protein KUCAC02_025804 [Chaenocephalus aceratus]|uniref:Uncharacterized protein n=1 Tax=Chaenocephalus aceratus TaxID=36190 RepID=A0ACB9VWQ6_CHAAC|nr:hypothetical protein KUCAC02_025804 [Chaenocephalus aceratus]